MGKRANNEVAYKTDLVLISLFFFFFFFFYKYTVV